MLHNRRELPEIYYMKHLHDDNTDYVDYEKMIFDKTLSPVLFENDVMNGYLKRLQPLMAMVFDQFNVIKNFKNFMVDKYYYKHKR